MRITDRWARRAVAVCFALSLLPGPAAGSPAFPDLSAAAAVLEEEVAIAEILMELKGEQPPVTVLRNVRVVDPVDSTVKDGQSIVVGGGVIFWVGETSVEPTFAGARIIDGQGRYASPGLVDMHVHSASGSSWLLNLANGVTTVREMDGFPWMLAAREAARSGRLLAPTSYVAGTIINYEPYDRYFVVAQDELTARRIVRQQAACGYDFVKVHNILPARIFDAVAAEAARYGMDVVGHVPQGMPVRRAVERGLRTMEHLKGYINDRTLAAGDTDYDAALNPHVWVTPTLYAFRRPAEQEAETLDTLGRYAPRRVRDSWAEQADVETLATQRAAGALASRIVGDLAAQDVQFLSGTDAANYPYQVMGYALIEEMRLLKAAGLPEAAVLRSATTGPAAAMRSPRDFGRLRGGMRGDVVLLDQNPLERPDAYARNQGVMARGLWLSRAALDRALAALAAIYASGPKSYEGDQISALVTRAQQAAAGGHVFNSRILADVIAAFRTAGDTGAADRLAALVIDPQTGPCAVETP